jgi:hypothetical protein
MFAPPTVMPSSVRARSPAVVSQSFGLRREKPSVREVVDDGIRTSGCQTAPSWDFSKISSVSAPLADLRQSPALGAGFVLQRKLEIGRVDDPLEREADRVAEQVLDLSSAIPKGNVRAGGPSLQRKCQDCADDEKTDHVTMVQTKAESGTVPATGSAPAIVHDVLRSYGRPLDSVLRASLEPRFGHDFGQVRVHTGAMASESARAVRARAYTVGADIVFGDGQYAPTTAEGRRLVAHELAHVVQQRAGATAAGPGLRLQRQPCDPRKDAIPTGPLTPTTPNIACDSSPKTLGEVRAVPGVPHTILGVTQSSFTRLVIGFQEKSAMRCKATVTQQNVLAITNSIFTKSGTYDDGNEVTPSGRPCSGKTVQRRLHITDAMAEKIKQGEIEHCEDKKYAFSISAAQFNQAANDLAAAEYCPKGPPLQDKGPACEREFRERFKARTGVDFDQQDKVSNCLIGKSKVRDDSHWHDIQSDAGTYDSGCGTVTYTPDPALARDIGTHDSSTIISGCAPAAASGSGSATTPSGGGSGSATTPSGSGSGLPPPPAGQGSSAPVHPPSH